jgi:hypothetical protein
MASHPSTTPRRQTAAVATGAGERRRRRAGWLKWLLPLLVAAAVVIALIALIGGGDDGDTSASRPGTASAPAGDAGDAGTLVAGNRALFPVPAGGLAKFAGDDVAGRQLRVLSVAGGEGFFVGTSKQDRLYVEFGGKTGENESGGLPAKGDKVNLQGEVRPKPEDPAGALHLSAADAQVVEREQGFINATDVSPAK